LNLRGLEKFHRKNDFNLFFIATQNGTSNSRSLWRWYCFSNDKSQYLSILFLPLKAQRCVFLVNNHCPCWSIVTL